MSLQKYEISQDHIYLLADACNPKSYLEQGAKGAFDVQARCAAVWVEIGAAMGFDPATVTPIEGMGVQAILAEPVKQ